MDFQDPAEALRAPRLLVTDARYREMGADLPLLKSVVAAAATGYTASSLISYQNAFLLAIFVGAYVYRNERRSELELLRPSLTPRSGAW